MRRILIGILALLFLAAAGTIFMRGDYDESQFLMSVCMRVGLVLAAMWLAYEQVLKLGKRWPPWVWGVIGLSMLVIVVRPNAILFVAPLIAGIAVLQFFGWLFKPLPNPRKSTRITPRRKDGSA
jgi:hypothetical protein